MRSCSRSRWPQTATCLAVRSICVSSLTPGTGIVSNSGFIESPDKEHLLSEITDRVGGVLEDVVRLGSVHGPGGYLCVQRAQLQGKLELESRSERSLLRRKQSVINAIQPARIEFGIDSY